MKGGVCSNGLTLAIKKKPSGTKKKWGEGANIYTLMQYLSNITGWHIQPGDVASLGNN